MLLKPHAKVIANYHGRYDLVIASALRGDALGQTILEHQREAMAAWELTPQELRYHSKLSTDVLNAIRPLRINDFKMIRGRVAPLPKLPSLLAMRLKKPADEVMRELFASDKVEAILSDSTFTPGDVRYRTDWKDGKPRLYGDNSPYLNSLAFLTHELGHCLAESVHPGDSFREKILSEAYAQTLEEATIFHWLKEDPQAQGEWKAYQRTIDQLNYHFYLWEISKHPAFSPLEALVPDIFDSALLLFRETLFTATGYQAVYARASLLRAKVLA